MKCPVCGDPLEEVRLLRRNKDPNEVIDYALSWSRTVTREVADACKTSAAEGCLNCGVVLMPMALRKHIQKEKENDTP